MTVVYRVETADGYGPYWSEHSNAWEIAIKDHRKGTEQHPSLLRDGHDHIPSAAIFAFTSIDQMRAWFIGAERSYLASFGLLLSCYVTAGSILGHKQCLFYRDNATLIWQKPLNHF